MKSTVIRLAGGCAAVCLLAGCGGGSEPQSAPASSPSATATPVTTSVETTSETSVVTATDDPHRLPDYGVVETTRTDIPAGTVTCVRDGTGSDTVEARVSAPGAPIVTIAIPEGFAPGAPANGDVALNLSGPDGVTATVRITPTTLDAAEAFQEYADARTADYEISSVSLLPAELCDYSGQELMGLLADKPGQGVDYADRVVHVWTDNGDFLVAVQVQAPTGTAAMDAAKSVLLGDFGIQQP